MKKLPIIAIALILSLHLQFPAIAAPTWIPEYQSSKSSYVSPELNLPTIESKLVESSSSHDIKFVSIATVKGDDLPEKGYARIVNDKFISKYGSQLGDRYITLVYVRDVNPLHGSFSMNAGSKLRDTFTASALTDLQKPVLRNYLPQDPNGAIIKLTAVVNDKVSSDKLTAVFFGTVLIILMLLISGIIIVVLVLNYANTQKELKSNWKNLDENIKKASERYVTLGDEIKFFDDKLLDTDAKKSSFENVKSKSVKAGEDIEAIYSSRESVKVENSDNLEVLLRLLNDANFTLNTISNDLNSLKGVNAYRNVFQQDYSNLKRETSTKPAAKTPTKSKPATVAQKPKTNNNSTNVVVENNYWNSYDSGRSSRSSSSDSSSSSGYDWGSSSSSSDSSSSSSSSDFGSSDSSSSSSDW